VEIISVQDQDQDQDQEQQHKWNGHSGVLGVLVHELVAEVKEPETETATPLEARFPASGREQATGLDVVEKERSGAPVEIISVQLQNGHSGALGVLVHKLVAEVKEPERGSATPLEARFPASAREEEARFPSSCG